MSQSVTVRATSQDEPVAQLALEIAAGSSQHRVEFESSLPVLVGNAEAQLGASLLVGMSEGQGIELSGAISGQLAESAKQLMDIYSVWDPALIPVNISAERRGEAPSRPPRVGAFFSGGVDSFYTLLKHRETITDLVLVHGFDVALEDSKLFEKTSEMAHRVADRFGKQVILIRTNHRAVLDRHVRWGLFGHGAALATIGHLLSPHLGRVLIAASHTYADMFPWGSHPLVDPLWGTESVQFIHDGCEATRIKKVALIADHDLALQSLRVCWKNPGGAYNCGRCEKCIRTMVNLKAVGALERCDIFDAPLDVGEVAKIRAYDESTQAFLVENLREFEKHSGEDELRQALRTALSRSEWTALIKKAAIRHRALYGGLQRANRTVRYLLGRR